MFKCKLGKLFWRESFHSTDAIMAVHCLTELQPVTACTETCAESNGAFPLAPLGSARLGLDTTAPFSIANEHFLYVGGVVIARLR